MQQRFVPSGNTIQEKYPDGKIYIAKIGDFANDICFDDLVDYIKRFLCLPVSVLNGLDTEQQGDRLSLTEDPTCNPSSRSGARIKRNTLHTRFVFVIFSTFMHV